MLYDRCSGHAVQLGELCCALTLPTEHVIHSQQHDTVAVCLVPGGQLWLHEDVGGSLFPSLHLTSLLLIIGLGCVPPLRTDLYVSVILSLFLKVYDIVRRRKRILVFGELYVPSDSSKAYFSEVKQCILRFDVGI